jgi:hypothetical protein
MVPAVIDPPNAGITAGSTQEPAPMADTTNQTVEPPDPKGLSLMQVLSTTDQGNVAFELNGAWNELIRTLRDLEVNEGVRKSKGSLTIKLGVEYEDGTIKLKVEETLKTPKAPQRAAVFWVTGDGRVTAENPRQMSMFRDVPRRTVTVL